MRQVIASKSMGNGLSLNIYGVEYGIDDKVIVGFNDDKPRGHKLYDAFRGIYFILGGRRFYIDEFIKV